MAPRSRSLRDLTPEELAALQSEFAPNRVPGAARRGFGVSSRGVPRLPQAANAPWRASVSMGDVEMLGPGGSGRELGPDLDPAVLDALQGVGPDLDPSKIRIDSQSSPRDFDIGVQPSLGAGGTDWLQELIDNPPQTPARPLSAMAPGGASFDGEDTPEAREVIKKGGMRITSAPTDTDLLGALTSDRPATMPELQTGPSLDELIAQESADMDEEQRAAAEARYAQAFPEQRMTREEALGDAGQGPTRMQGIAALIGDAFFGGGMLDKLAARGAAARNARAEARIGDIQAAEHAEDREAQRGLTRELTMSRLGVTTRGQDLRAETQQESLEQRRARGEQVDQRIVSEGEKNRSAADARADKNLQARVGPQLSPEDQQAALQAQLAADANVSDEKTAAYLAGQPTPDTTPEELSRLKQFHARWKGLGQHGQQKLIENTSKREAGTTDQIAAAVTKKKLLPDKERLKLRTELGDTKAQVTSAIKGWTSLSPTARKVLVSVGNAGDANSVLNALRKASLSGEEQAAAASIWTLLNELLHRRSGAAVTNQEMVRIADEAGLPASGWASAFTSPQVMHQWLGKLREAAIRRRQAVQAEYEGLEGL